MDFALSNLVNAGVTDVGVVLHGHYQSLLDHLHRQGLGPVPQAGRLEDPAPLCIQAALGEAAVFRGKMEALAASAPIWRRSAGTMWCLWTATWW